MSDDSDLLYRSLVEHLPAVVYLDMDDGTPIWVSPQVTTVLGGSRERWMSGLSGWAELIHPDDRERVLVAYRAARAAGRPYNGEYRVLREDGAVRWVTDQAARVERADGTVLMQGLISDVTDRKRAELAAEAGERALRETFANLPLAALMQAIDGTVVYCNDRLAAAVGHTPGELVGRIWGEMVSPPRSYDDEWSAALRRGEVVPYIESLVDSPGRGRRTYAWWCAPVHDIEGRLVAAASLGLDITEHRQAQEALVRSEQRSRRVLSLIMRAEEEERARIAEELHDDTVQVLTAALLALDRASATLDRAGHAAEVRALSAARDTLLAATERARRLMFELRPQLLEAQGLEAAVRALVAQAGTEAGFDTRLEVELGRYARGVEGMVYRTVREAVANARRHSRARLLTVALRENGGTIRGSVGDDGVGFDRAAVRDRPDAHLHQGLDAAAERLRLAGGAFAVESGSGGTLVTFSVPTGAA